MPGVVEQETPVGAAQQEKPPASHLGMEIGLRANRSTRRYQFEWRHALARRQKWWKQCSSSALTCRMVSHFVGIIVWNSHIHLEPLAYVKPTIDMLRKALSIKTGWDKTEPLLRDNLHLLKVTTRSICLDSSWMYRRELTGCQRIYVASDASSKKWGYVVYDESLVEIRQACDHFDQKMWASRHIFVKELLAAVLSIEWCCQHLGSERGLEIVIAVDNTAAAGVLRRLYSVTILGDELVRRVIRALDSRHTLRVLTVRSEDNPSDPLTRTRPLCPARNAVFREIVSAYQVGRHITALPKDNPQRTHEECDDVNHEFSSDDEANEQDDDETFAKFAEPNDDGDDHADARTEDDVSTVINSMNCGPSE